VKLTVEITSSEVENALYAHPAVSEAVAIGLPHEQLGEVVGAAVALRDGHAGKVSEEALLLSLKDRSVFIVPLGEGDTGHTGRSVQC
jgi:acyl-CoA synthetase (AMP-forming)/AMP-acid ligase II